MNFTDDSYTPKIDHQFVHDKKKRIDDHHCYFFWWLALPKLEEALEVYDENDDLFDADNASDYDDKI